MTTNRASPLPPPPAPLPAKTTAYPLPLLTWEWRAVAHSGINLPLSPWKVAAANRALVQPISRLLKAEVAGSSIHNITWCPANHRGPNCPGSTSPFVLPVWLQLLFPGRSAAVVLDAWAPPPCSTLQLRRAAIVCGRWAHTADWHIEGQRCNLQLLPSLPSRQLSARHSPSSSSAAPSPLHSFLPSQVVPSVPGHPCRLFHRDSHGAGGVQRPQWWILPSDFLPWGSSDPAGPQESQRSSGWCWWAPS